MIFSTAHYAAAVEAFSLFGFELELVGLLLLLVKRSKGPREPCSIMFGLALLALCGDLA